MRLVLNEAKRAYYKSPYQTYKVTKYLFFPKCINGEIRWLETATWARKATFDYSALTLGAKRYYWENIDWIEEENKTCV